MVNVSQTKIVAIVFVRRPIMAMIVYCGFGQCREKICECHSGYTSARCDIPRILPLSYLSYEGRCRRLEGYTGYYCDTPRRSKEHFQWRRK